MEADTERHGRYTISPLPGKRDLLLKATAIPCTYQAATYNAAYVALAEPIGSLLLAAGDVMLEKKMMGGRRA